MNKNNVVVKNVKFSCVEDVKKFVRYAEQQSFEIDLVNGRYVIDGKIIMGIFSLDLSTPKMLEIHASNDEAEGFLEKIKDICM